MDKNAANNLKVIYGIDLILLGIALALRFTVDGFEFLDRLWLLFLMIPSLMDIILNKLNFANGSLFVISASLFGFFVALPTANDPSNEDYKIAGVICGSVLVILLGVILLFGKKLTKTTDDNTTVK